MLLFLVLFCSAEVVVMAVLIGMTTGNLERKQNKQSLRHILTPHLDGSTSRSSNPVSEHRLCLSGLAQAFVAATPLQHEP